MSRPVVTRFAPSPTGMMHIGTARTGLFNMYFAKKRGGKCLLRIEDTDRERSTQEAVDGLLRDLAWLGFQWDGEAIMQFPRAPRHAEIAHEMVKKGTAYYCYMTPEEIDAERAKAEAAGTMWHYDRRWRDSTQAPPAGVKPVIRIKAPLPSENAPNTHMTIVDEVQGNVSVAFEQLDDFILLRSDGTPTYMLAVVVDDHDMGVTHVIRGDDHLNNTFRQNLIYYAMGWTPPIYAHVPLIHGPDGKKLSKRKGSAAVHEYKEMGYLPEAMRNYLLRLGWSHGNDEIISDTQAIAWFDLEHIGQSPSQLDFAKLNFINHHYMQQYDSAALYVLAEPFLRQELDDIQPQVKDRIIKGMNGLKERSQTLVELAKNARFYKSITLDDGAKEKLNQPHACDVLTHAAACIDTLGDWNGKALIEATLAKTGLKMGQVGPVLRAALTGTMQSPDLSEVITALGPDEVKKRLAAAA